MRPFVYWLTMLLGVVTVVFSDVYFRIGEHAAEGVDPHAYDVIGTLMVIGGGVLLMIDLLANLEDK